MTAEVLDADDLVESRISLDGETPATATNSQKAYVSHKQTDATTFAGVRGSVGDTGVSYVFQARSKKSKGTHGGRAYAAATANAVAVPGIQSGANVPTNSSSPWFLGLSRSLGGGASVHFEHANSDDGEKSVSYLALKIDF